MFQNAVSIFGVPDCVHTDKGGENVGVWWLMIRLHASPSVIIASPSVVIAGSSTHNVHIQRLWRDVFRCVSGHYYELFYALEEQHLLDPLMTQIYIAFITFSFLESTSTFMIFQKVGTTTHYHLSTISLPTN